MYKSRYVGSRYGLTLMEILIVISIIAVLASIVFASMSGVAQRASTAKCQSNLHQLGAAFQLYANDNENRLPGQGFDYTDRWMQQIAVYVGVADKTTAYWQPIFHCPLVDKSAVGAKGPNNGSGIYGYPLTIATYNTSQGPSKLSVDSLVSTVLLADKNFKGVESDGPSLVVNNPYPQTPHGVAANHRSDKNPAKGPSGQANYLYLDGHVGTLTEWPGMEAFLLHKTH